MLLSRFGLRYVAIARAICAVECWNFYNENIYSQEACTYLDRPEAGPINEYYARGFYAGIRALMRSDVLYQYVGFIADADAICFHPVDELFTENKL